MNCDEFVELVTAYLDGALDAHTAARFTEHLAACDGCDRYLEQIRHTVGELHRLPGDSLAGHARDRLLAAFRDWPGSAAP
ncbi:anti-sigma factor family protein [Actinocrinis sp.]|uniref:anti-sigma factor family protein n=1 Tax=Actinocrinis sp. TaxID=1920516 RepID=UPI002D44633D|nr:zf-HC2 domain-containing protein [Actinocrinis sp.]HZP50059.1 zf-HC2 domain-containing protein [Actinocrinis sp.]